MKKTYFTRHLLGTAVLTCSAVVALTPPAVLAQPPQFGQGQGGFGGRGGGPGGGPGGPGGPGGGTTLELTEEFDADENGWLNKAERAAAREQAQAQSQSGRRGGPGGRGRGGNSGPAEPGRQVRPDQVDQFPDADLYAVDTLRTLFFEFENEDWEKELEDFRRTDVEVPATLTVDGKTYENVGMRFRGASSYFMVPTGRKRSFNVSMDLADEDQRLYGFKTLNLLNSNGDPSFMSSVLYAEIANQYIPAPRANHVHVVINGESWGVYVNVQQFNKDFLKEHYESSKGTRWKVSGSPNADGGLRYLGEDLEQYQQRYDMKSSDGKKAWAALVKLCQTLDETPLDQLEEALEPMLDVDGALKFLALDVALVNSDGYWTRASDYSLFLDKDNRFHVIPHDMNEAFQSGRGGGGPGGPGGFGPPGFGGFGGGPGGGPGGGFGGPGGPGGFGDFDFGGGPGFGPPPGFENGPEGLEGGRRERSPGGDRASQDGGQRGDAGPGREDRGGRGGFGGREGDRGGRGGFGGREGDRGGRGGFGGRDSDRGGRGGFGGRDSDRGGRGGFGGRRGGPGGGPGHGGVDLDPLVSVDNPRMPLRSRLLAVPSLRARYLQYMQEIAEKSLDWNRIGPQVGQSAELIAEVVAADTKKMTTTEAFEQATSDKADAEASLRSFFDQRRKFLLEYKPAVQNDGAADR